jgi:hypothetical protein
MVVTSDNVFSNESVTLGQVSARQTVPVIGAYRDFAPGGRLDEQRNRPLPTRIVESAFARRAFSTEKKPGDLPVQHNQRKSSLSSI